MHYVPITNQVLLTLLFTMLHQLVSKRRVLYQLITLYHLCIYKSSYKVTMDLPGCLQCSLSRPYCPRFDLIFADSIKMTQLQLIIPSLNNLIPLGFLTWLYFLLELNRVGNYTRMMLSIKCYSTLYFLLVWKFSLKIITFVQVYQVNHRFCS